MSERTHFAHSILLADSEVETMGHHHVSAAHCPVGNFRIGPPKVHALRRAGVRVGLGSDGASSGTVDILQINRAFRTGFQAVFATPWHVLAEQDDIDFLHMATQGGAEIVALKVGDTGGIEVVARVEVIVAQILVHGTMELIGARSGHHAHEGSAVSKSSGRARLLHLEFLGEVWVKQRG